ncbi:omptin family outer membrane protease [Salmonella enterica]|nr:omptin family outer membrane protease [Salmonella enterica subsp. salamae]EKC2494636.1 omptin family outer membrane protease [Salmonella enterica]EMD3916479.1 omptin family outer membrane protease [Salmonella enterica]
MKRRYLALAVACIPAVSYASVQPPENIFPSGPDASLSFGWAGGEAREYVYDTTSGKKISQLNWKIKSAYILKAGLSWDVQDWITLNAGGWTTLASGSGVMNDYDWLDDNRSGWSDWSHHPDTRLNWANELDLNVKGWLIRQDNYRAGLMTGWQQTRFSWTASGGSFDHNNHSRTGDYLPGKVVDYSQKFTMPYVGIVGQYRYHDIEFNGQVKFSNRVSVEANDEHYTRGMTFRDGTGNSRYVSASVDVGYYMTPGLRIFTDFTYSVFGEGKGGTKITYADKSHEYIGGNASGTENKNYMITAGLSYRF